MPYRNMSFFCIKIAYSLKHTFICLSTSALRKVFFIFRKSSKRKEKEKTNLQHDVFFQQNFRHIYVETMNVDSLIISKNVSCLAR